jgi:hypothetical protein
MEQAEVTKKFVLGNVKKKSFGSVFTESGGPSYFAESGRTRSVAEDRSNPDPDPDQDL